MGKMGMNLALAALFVLILGQTSAAPSSEPTSAPSNSLRQPHDLILCDLKEGDKLLMRTQIKEKAHFLGYVDVDFTYPPPGGYEFKEVIHCIKAMDGVSDDNGGYATIKSGGLNQNTVTINLRSKFNRGIEFIVEIHGQDPTATTTTAAPNTTQEDDQ